MKNNKDYVYINKTSIILAFSLIIFPILFGLPLLFFKQFIEYTIILIVAIIFLILIIIIRKQLFAKIYFDENGIYRKYRHNIINFINWNDVQEIRVIPKHHIVFLRESKSLKEINNNYKSNIIFYISDKALRLLAKYKEYFKVELLNIDKLSSYEKEILN